ncbi:unnamed protein product, partial [Ranitomeya imitator]
RRCSDTDNDPNRCSVAVWSLESCHTDRSPATNDAGNQGKHRPHSSTGSDGVAVIRSVARKEKDPKNNKEENGLFIETKSSVCLFSPSKISKTIFDDVPLAQVCILPRGEDETGQISGSRPSRSTIGTWH